MTKVQHFDDNKRKVCWQDENWWFIGQRSNKISPRHKETFFPTKKIITHKIPFNLRDKRWRISCLPSSSAAMIRKNLFMWFLIFESTEKYLHVGVEGWRHGEFSAPSMSPVFVLSLARSHHIGAKVEDESRESLWKESHKTEGSMCRFEITTLSLSHERFLLHWSCLVVKFRRHSRQMGFCWCWRRANKWNSNNVLKGIASLSPFFFPELRQLSFSCVYFSFAFHKSSAEFSFSSFHFK